MGGGGGGGHFRILSTTYIKCLGCKILNCHNYIIPDLEPFSSYKMSMRGCSVFSKLTNLEGFFNAFSVLLMHFNFNLCFILNYKITFVML